MSANQFTRAVTMRPALFLSAMYGASQTMDGAVKLGLRAYDAAHKSLLRENYRDNRRQVRRRTSYPSVLYFYSTR
jgi:hypothetical protein